MNRKKALLTLAVIMLVSLLGPPGSRCPTPCWPLTFWIVRRTT